MGWGDAAAEASSHRLGEEYLDTITRQRPGYTM